MYTAIKELVLPTTMRSLYANAFRECPALANVTLNDGLTLIGGGAFAYCKLIKSIFIPSSVNQVGVGIFTDIGLSDSPLIINIEHTLTGENTKPDGWDSAWCGGRGYFTINWGATR